MTIWYCAGLDLGQQQDYTALSIVEVAPSSVPVTVATRDRELGLPMDQAAVLEGPPAQHRLRHLERFPLGTSYPQMVRDVQARLARVPGQWLLAIDYTGVGRAVGDIFTEAGVPYIGVTLTGGQQPHWDGAHCTCPKRDLVFALLVALQQQRFAAAQQLQLAPVLTKELASFRLKFSQAGHDSYEAWRESDHDDCVLSVATAVWVAEQFLAQQYAQAVADLEAAAFNDTTRVSISPF